MLMSESSRVQDAHNGFALTRKPRREAVTNRQRTPARLVGFSALLGTPAGGERFDGYASTVTHLEV